jgi:integrase
VWRPAAIEAGVTGDLRPYRLRGSLVSLLLWSGENLAYVAEQAGHSIATLARRYAGVLKELHGQPKIPAAEAIRRARGRRRPAAAAQAMSEILDRCWTGKNRHVAAGPDPQ